MTYIPDEAPYTDKYLKEEDKEFMKGWDAAVSEIFSYFNNRDDITGLKTLDKILSECSEDIRDELLDWIARARQQFIVGIIDSYTDEELKERGYEG